MILSLSAPLLLFALQSVEAEAPRSPELDAAMQAQNDCVEREVETRVGDEVVSMPWEAQKAVGKAVADACHEKDRAVANLMIQDPSQRYGKDKQGVVLDAVTALTHAIADVSVVIRVHDNAEKAKGAPHPNPSPEGEGLQGLDAANEMKADNAPD